MSSNGPFAIVPWQTAVGPSAADTPPANPVAGEADSQSFDPPPVRPAEPDAADCCGEGCVRCVYDRYDEALERYQLALAKWQARHH